MADSNKDKCHRGNLRRQLASGKSLKGFDLSPEKLSEMWPVFLDMHVRTLRPGRAVALLDVATMLEHSKVRISDGSSGASSSTDSSTTRALSPAELRTISDWLTAHRAETPAAASELRATEVVFSYARRPQWSGRSPLAPPRPHETSRNARSELCPRDLPPSHRSSILDAFRDTRFFATPPRPP